jgi:integrase
MPRKWPRHFLVKPSGFYFQTTPAMKQAGITSEPLGKEMTAAIARAEALNAAWDEIRQGLEPVTNRPAHRGTFSHLVEKLRASKEWTDKGQRTIEELEYALGVIEPLFGDFALKQITPEACRMFYDLLREKGSIHRAHKVMKWFRYLFNFALRYKLADQNPTLAVRIKHPAPREALWGKEQIGAVIAKATEEGRPCIALAVQIAHATALREADVLGLTWGQFDGERLVLKQGKTGKAITCPLSAETVKMIEERRTGTIPLANAPIIRGPHGRRYLKSNFAHRFRDICRTAGIPDDLKFMDLRRTTATELAAAGATAPEIAAVTGHSIARSQQILDTYVRTNEEMARNAQAKRNKRGPKV